MTQTDPIFHPTLAEMLDAALARHGLRAVVLSLAAALIRARRMRASAARLHGLDDHLRRDIGLPPRGPSPPDLPLMRELW